MSRIVDLSTQVSDIVIKVPQADKVLKRIKIDFCCGGKRPLKDVVLEKGLSGDELINEIHELYLKSKQSVTHDWLTVDYQTLISHIIHTHHEYLLEELPQLSMYTTKLMRVHGDIHPELHHVHSLFHELKLELEQHLVKEEKQVFPHIVEYEEKKTSENLTKAVVAIEELEKEHEHAGDILKQLRSITSEFQAPEDACTTYRLTYQKLEALEGDLFQHIHLENNILFPRLLKEKN